ncbi:unnamed protein product [Caenorhabditis sp. 36 PRJEB53466]|nr:unnamed protein product [Caenorhabditis sp. 36 PRJEB53466]
MVTSSFSHSFPLVLVRHQVSLLANGMSEKPTKARDGKNSSNTEKEKEATMRETRKRRTLHDLNKTAKVMDSLGADDDGTLEQSDTEDEPFSMVKMSRFEWKTNHYGGRKTTERRKPKGRFSKETHFPWLAGAEGPSEIADSQTGSPKESVPRPEKEAFLLEFLASNEPIVAEAAKEPEGPKNDIIHLEDDDDDDVIVLTPPPVSGTRKSAPKEGTKDPSNGKSDGMIVKKEPNEIEAPPMTIEKGPVPVPVRRHMKVKVEVKKEVEEEPQVPKEQRNRKEPEVPQAPAPKVHSFTGEQLAEYHSTYMKTIKELETRVDMLGAYLIMKGGDQAVNSLLTVHTNGLPLERFAKRE